MILRRLALATEVVEVSLDGSALAERFDWRYGADPQDTVSPESVLRIALRPAPPGARDGAWQAELSSRREGDGITIDWPQARGRFDFAAGAGEFEVCTEATGFGRAIDDILRVLGFEIALAGGVLLLHAAAVGPASSNWVDLFAGRSDAGKTTVTERLIAAGESAISDDLVFVDTGEQGAPAALPTPFKGSTRSPARRKGRSRVRSLAFLSQTGTSREPGFLPLVGAEKLGRILSAVVRYRPLEAAETERIATAASRLAGACPAGSLALNLASDPRTILDAGLSDG